MSWHSKETDYPAPQPWPGVTFSLDGPRPHFWTPTWVEPEAEKATQGEMWAVFRPGEKTLEDAVFVETIESGPPLPSKDCLGSVRGKTGGFRLDLWKDGDWVCHHHLMVGSQLRDGGNLLVEKAVKTDDPSRFIDEALEGSCHCRITPKNMQFFSGELPILVLCEREIGFGAGLAKGERILPGRWLGRKPFYFKIDLRQNRRSYFEAVVKVSGSGESGDLKILAGVEFLFPFSEIDKAVRQLIKREQIEESSFRQIVNPYLRVVVEGEL